MPESTDATLARFDERIKTLEKELAESEVSRKEDHEELAALKSRLSRSGALIMGGVAVVTFLITTAFAIWDRWGAWPK